MAKEKLIKQLFVGKVADILGDDKTQELLKEATDEINAMKSQGEPGNEIDTAKEDFEKIIYPEGFRVDLAVNIEDLTSNIDKLIIQGLKNKGFEFKDGKELMEFVKASLMMRTSQNLNQTTYYVNEIPFLLEERFPSGFLKMTPEEIDFKNFRLTAECRYSFL